MNSFVQTEARKVNLSPADFARLAIVRALARVGKDPYLEARAKRATGEGWKVLDRARDVPPQAGDELSS